MMTCRRCLGSLAWGSNFKGIESTEKPDSTTSPPEISAQGPPQSPSEALPGNVTPPPSSSNMKPVISQVDPALVEDKGGPSDDELAVLATPARADNEDQNAVARLPEISQNRFC